MEPTFVTASEERRRLVSAELVVGYALSRLGAEYLAARGHASWRAAYEELVRAFGRMPGSWKRLRDEFDPFTASGRRGFHDRPMRPDRAYVFAQMEGVDDDALLELVDRFVAKDWTATEEVVEVVAAPRSRIANVAERLLTGRRAEEFFLEHAAQLVAPTLLTDTRCAAGGYDFDLGDGRVAEVKGLKGWSGSLLFTDREWTAAKDRRGKYLLVVVGGLEGTPKAEVLADPTLALTARSLLETRLVSSWRASYAMSD